VHHADGGLTADPSARGRVLAGTSGFSYAGWTPRFYPRGVRAPDRLAHYAGRLPACELNGTFYARPTPERLDAWAAAVPADFRFVVKGQRGGSIRALYGDPAESVPWLTEHLTRLGARLGAMLFRIPSEVARNDERLGGVLGPWPAAVPLVVEAQHPSWHVDETFAALRAAGAVLCTTDLDGQETPPDIRRTGPFLYLRLRRHEYADADLDAWARRLVPFLDDGLDAFVIFRHDEDGTSALLAEGFAERVERLLATG
jgi:uncharacterized protein YecE (DUF72 family)